MDRARMTAEPKPEGSKALTSTIAAASSTITAENGTEEVNRNRSPPRSRASRISRAPSISSTSVS